MQRQKHTTISLPLSHSQAELKRIADSIIESVTYAVNAANTAAAASVSGQEQPAAICLSSVTISQFAEMMEGLSLERYMRLKKEVEAYVDLAQQIGCVSSLSARACIL